MLLNLCSNPSGPKGGRGFPVGILGNLPPKHPENRLILQGKRKFLKKVIDEIVRPWFISHIEAHRFPLNHATP